MSSSYWDPYSTGGTSTSPYWSYDGPDTSASSTPTYIHPFFFRPVIVRRILVEMPEGWTEEMSMSFVRLVNIETKTGWKVTLVIKGKVLITDPNVERRTLADFIPLLKDEASQQDIDLINAFFEKNPIKPA